MLEESVALLYSHHIRPCQETASFICAREECLVEVPAVRKAFVQHLRRNGHSVRDQEAVFLWRAAERCAESFSKNHPLREKYRSGGARHGKLPSIDGLLVVQGKCCPKCDVIFQGDSTLRRHGSVVHKACFSRKEIRNLTTLPCQSLSRKCASKKLFLIEDPEAGNLHCGQGIGRFSEMLAKYDPGNVPETYMATVSDRERSGFVSLAKCQERLYSAGLSITDAWSLTRAKEGVIESARFSSQTVKQLFVDARELFRDVDGFRSTLVDISPGGTLEKSKPFQFLNNDEAGNRSLERYARSAQVLLLVAIRVHRHREKYPEISMSEPLVRALDDLASCDDTEQETVCMRVHRVLCSIFFERSSITEGSVRLFSFKVAACLCVGGESMDRLHFKQGSQVASQVTGILYAASCCALLEMRKYSDVERRNEVEAEVRLAMCTSAKRGLSVFVDMRSICASVRAEETPVNVFKKCPVHPLCGFMGGVEVSADAVEDAERIVPSVGRTVRSVNRDLRKRIFVDLLKDKVLPPRFLQECTSIVDDDTNLVPGYWALADVRNSEFVSRCNRWIRDEVIPCLPETELDAWTTSAKSLVPMFLTAMHLGAGGPGRGTEIGSMGLRNTPSCKRAVLFVGEELTINPWFNKSRSVRQCQNFFISRHVDRETSFLYKAFLLLVHPVMVQYAEMKEQSEEVPPGAEREALLRERCLLRDNICFGVVKPVRVAERIGAVLAKYKFPLSFSQFRQWQRGYVKMKGRDSLLLKCLALESREAEDSGNGNDDVHQAAVVQAGHSTRTASLFYAQSSGLGGVSAEPDEHLVELFRLASYEWQTDIGMRMKAELLSEEGASSRTRSEARDLTGQQLSRLADVVADSVLKRLESLQWSTGCVSEFNHDAEPVENVFLRPSSEASTENELSMETATRQVSEKKCSSSGENGFDATNALRKVTGKSTVEFRSAEQKYAMKAVAARRSDVAVILATGCGKTAIVMGPIL